jgi:hypothetical protein
MWAHELHGAQTSRLFYLKCLAYLTTFSMADVTYYQTVDQLRSKKLKKMEDALKYNFKLLKPTGYVMHKHV